MNYKLTRWLAVASFAIAGAIPPVNYRALADDAAPQTHGEVADIDQLKTQAFSALRIGNFDAGNDLLGQAAKLSPDPTLAKMHAWTNDFEAQLHVFAGERHKSYAKAVEDVEKVRPRFEDYALDFAESAQLLSDDKKTFHELPWVKSLISDAITHAAVYEKNAEWSHAARLYTDLAAVEPASKEWKEKLKSCMRRVRLLAIYAPDVYHKQQEKDIVERDEVLALLAPPAATQPATRPANPNLDALGASTKPTEAARNENFKIDWHDTVRGIEMDMLTSAMNDAFSQYYRDVTYRGLMAGGLNGIDAVLNTKGLETTFPTLGDANKRAEFQKFVDDWKAKVASANADNEKDLIDTLLSEDKDGMLAANARTLQLPNEVLISEFADGALATLDPFTSMIWPSDLAEFTKATQGEFSGIGVQILPEENGDLTIVRPLPDSPAERAGIKSADVISKINGKSAKNITSDEAVKSITGPSGTTVNVSIRSPDGTLRDYVIRRQKIKVQSVEGYKRKDGNKWDYYIDPENKIAYMKITSFSRTTVDELHAAIDSMGDNVNGVIIDLRGNPGGLLQAAIGVCDEFLKDGTIVSTHPDRETANPPMRASAKDEGTEFTKPLVVLVNQYSASASEIVSGALKDDHRAILVGQRTFGKGSVQQIFPPDRDSKAQWKITTAHYYLPSGRCIHREETSTEWGVDPDVVVDMTPEQMRAAQEAAQETELGRAVNHKPAEGQDQKLKEVAPAVNQAIKDATTQPSATTLAAEPTTKPAHRTLLEADPQLSAGVLVIRLEVAGAHL